MGSGAPFGQPGSGQEPAAALDFTQVFAGLPTAYLVMDARLVIVAANEAYLRLLGRRREELIGRPVFDAFPPAPAMLDADGANPLQLSFERVRDTGRVDTMPMYQYDVADLSTGSMTRRYWSLVHAPLRDAQGSTRWILQRVEDVSAYVTERAAHRAARRRSGEWQRRFEAVEADLYARATELRRALDAEATATQRLAAMAQVTLRLAEVDALDEMTRTVVEDGLAALGAVGGAVGVVDESTGRLRLRFSSSLGGNVRHRFSDVALDSGLPPAHAALSGEVVVLAPPGDGAVTSPETAEFVRACHDGGARGAPGMSVALPFRSDKRLLGSLWATWPAGEDLGPGEMDQLKAFGAQCAHALARLQARAAERQEAAASREMAEALQRGMLASPATPDHVEVAVRYLPAAQGAQIGGDWYDAFTTGDGTVALVVGDVAGHDSDAAASMGQLRNLLRGVALALTGSPAAVLTRLDEALETLGVHALATTVLAHVAPAGDQNEPHLVVWSNAGHPPPMLIRPDAPPTLLHGPAELLLGFDAAADRSDHHVELGPGTTLVFYSDGLVEHHRQDIDAGLQRLLAAGAEAAHLPLEQLCDALLREVQPANEDDIVILAARARGRQDPGASGV
ncbi:MAG TPA: SpoIIE family protein phosphatase [Acidimicrobiales bacterium]|nr:SpoIIE family protein phosphatase [Acidimicrobiales bacterium]